MSFLDRISRTFAMTCGVISGVIALIFNIAGAANKHWLAFKGHHQGLFKICRGSECTDLNPSGAEKTALNGTRAFVVLGVIAAAAMLAAASIGRFLKACAHPWPKYTFVVTCIYFGCNLIALFSFDSYKDEAGRGSVKGGIAPIILGLFHSAVTVFLLYWKFGLAGVLGSGALPEDTSTLYEE